MVFTALGEMPNGLIDTWTNIWDYFSHGTSHKRVFTADYEVHWSNESVDVYIAVGGPTERCAEACGQLSHSPATEARR